MHVSFLQKGTRTIILTVLRTILLTIRLPCMNKYTQQLTHLTQLLSTLNELRKCVFTVSVSSSRAYLAHESERDCEGVSAGKHKSHRQILRERTSALGAIDYTRRDYRQYCEAQ